MELQLARWRRAVDAFSKTDERNPQRLKFFDERDEMPEIPPEPIQSPADQDIELAPFRIGDERIQSWTPVLRPTDTTVYVLLPDPAACLKVAPKFPEAGSPAPGQVCSPWRRLRLSSLLGLVHGSVVLR